LWKFSFAEPNGAKTGASSVQRDRVAQLVEKALRHLLGLAGQDPDLAQQSLLLRVQVFRDDDLHDDVLIAAPPTSHVRHAPALQPEGLPVLGAGGDRDLDRPLEGRDLDPVPKRRLDHVHAKLEDDVLVVARKLGMALDTKHHIEVAGRTPAEAGLPLPADPDL